MPCTELGDISDQGQLGGGLPRSRPSTAPTHPCRAADGSMWLLRQPPGLLYPVDEQQLASTSLLHARSQCYVSGGCCPVGPPELWDPPSLGSPWDPPQGQLQHFTSFNLQRIAVASVPTVLPPYFPGYKDMERQLAQLSLSDMASPVGQQHPPPLCCPPHLSHWGPSRQSSTAQGDATRLLLGQPGQAQQHPHAWGP